MSNDILTYRRNVTSEHGEDGIIERIFNIIGEESRWCVELGALNGVHGSNVWSLVQKRGWSGVLIEADKTQFERLQKEYAYYSNAHCIDAYVSFEGEQSLDNIFSQTPLPRTFDLFSLDIDGNDYHLWESLNKYRPRVMVVEFNPSIPNNVAFVQPRDMRVFQGSSLRSLIELGKQKGYELVAANEANAFFVLQDLFPKFGISDNSIDALHTDTQFQTQFFQLYDGTLRIAGNSRLIWHDRPIDIKKLQVLGPSARRYPARVSSGGGVRRLKYYVRKLPLYSVLMRLKKWITRR